jgi:hypothetical protein
MPLICSKAHGQAGDEMVAERDAWDQVVEDASLVDAHPHAVGDRFRNSYTDIARLLVRFGI